MSGYFLPPNIDNIPDNKVPIGESNYGDRRYVYYYDTETGDANIQRINRFGPQTTVFEDGGFTEEGIKDENLYTNGVTYEQVQDDLANEIIEAYKKSGGTANNSILPNWVENKYPDELENAFEDTDLQGASIKELEELINSSNSLILAP